MFEFLSKNAGPRFLQGIPALHDPWLSLGMYQFTSKALYEGPGGPRGASIINHLITDQSKRIPSSVIHLDTYEEQTRATQLFAIENLAVLIGGIRSGGDARLRDQRLARLENHGSTSRIGIMQYISSAHHLPAPARTGYRAWIDADFQGSHAALCRPVLGEYVIKSNGNYHEIDKRLRG